MAVGEVCSGSPHPPFASQHQARTCPRAPSSVHQEVSQQPEVSVHVLRAVPAAHGTPGLLAESLRPSEGGQDGLVFGAWLRLYVF